MAVRIKTHPTTAYAQSVIAGAIPAGKLVRLACERHLRDLETGAARALRFDEAAANRALQFFGFLKQSKGEWGGLPLVLQLWQEFIVGSIFGWKRADGNRRFRVAYIEVPRKNGKSTLSAAVGLYLLVADGEPGAEIFTAATKRDQARIVHGEAVRMVKASPALRKIVGTFKDNLHVERTSSKYEPLGADADTMDGLNIHGAIVDELHAHKTRAVVDVLETATGARRQPLMFYITTAGYDRESVCWAQHQYGEQILRGTVDDDTFFVYIATIDEGDAWTDPAVWAKANPNLGVSVKLDDLQRKADKAKQIPSEQNSFLRLHLDVWTQQSSRWIDLGVWDENAGAIEVEEEMLAGRPCYGGLDLSSVSDLTAWVLVFPRDDDPEEVDILCRFWCPESWALSPHNRYASSYQAWQRQGYLTVTEGNAIDYGVVRAKVVEDAVRFRLIDLNIDRLFQGQETSMVLQGEGIEVFPMGQGFYSMAAPMKEFERRLLGRKLHHGGNPILRFMVQGAAVSQDPAGNLKFNKGGSQTKIDGLVALVMALDRAVRHGESASVYEEHGLTVL